jgi:hypothetical protein
VSQPNRIPANTASSRELTLILENSRVKWDWTVRSLIDKDSAIA